ncbi:MAG: hypothetical protein JW787_15230 [Sedimentisphaerales bacterium]|nr:hypothetical protein [Sedimentisphaerales bacterium]
MMIFPASITFPANPWIWMSLCILAVLFVLLIWTYRRATAIRPGNKAAFLLKLLGILILMFCMIEPLWSGRRAKPGANLFVVAADNSSGMNILDKDTDKPRSDTLRKVLDTNDSKWLDTLADYFQVRRYIFDSRLKRTSDFSEMAFDGRASSIGTTLRTIANRYSSRPLAGIILLSDGNATDMLNQPFDLSNIPPVYPVVIGSSKTQKDISLSNVSVSQSSFEDAPVTIQADIDTSGYAGKTIAIDLLDKSGKLVERKTENIGRAEQKKVVDFRLKPDENGVLFYNIEVKEKTDSENASQPDVSSEATMVNNRQTFAVDRGGGPYRILYVTGRPNWEYKFLRRAVAEDEQIRLTALVRVAKREPKFNWIGHTGENTNPLYRGFGNEEDETAEQYDQPVLIRLYPPDEEEDELREGFPISEEGLYAFHAIILDDVESEFFTTVQMTLIRKFVAERGGGFMMFGGKESFQQGNFVNSAIGQILPVYLDKLPDRPASGQMHIDLSKEGWLLPWARLRDNELDEKRRLSEMPAFKVLNRLASVKPGASVVAYIGNEYAQQFPAVVVQRFGNGRTAALTIGDIWRWGMKESELHNDMDKFWRQSMRWLVADVPERITLQAEEKADQVNQPVVLRAGVRDKDFEPMDNVSVSIEVCEPQGDRTMLKVEPVLNETGMFEATYIPRINGGYLAKAIVKDKDETEIGNAETGWASELDAMEFKSIKTNRPLLEKIARQTGGKVIEIKDLDSFVRDLPKRDVPVSETWTRPLWDMPWVSQVVFLLVLLCFVGEWALRRWKGIP